MPTLPYLWTTSGSGSGQQNPFNMQQNTNTDKQAQITADTVTVLRKEIVFFQNTSDELHKTVITIEDLEKVTHEMNEEISNLDDFFRPVKSYFYWEKHCFDVPMCWAFRSLFDALDNIDHLAADIKDVRTSLEAIDRHRAANNHAAETHGRRHGGNNGSFNQHLRPVGPAVHTDRPDILRPGQCGARLRPVQER